MAAIKPKKLGKTYVRIMGRQLDRFIEFEFILNDESLSVELVLPEHAFAEFCDYYDAEILPPESEGGEVIPLKEHSAGLYKAPDSAEED